MEVWIYVSLLRIRKRAVRQTELSTDYPSDRDQYLNDNCSFRFTDSGTQCQCSQAVTLPAFSKANMCMPISQAVFPFLNQLQCINTVYTHMKQKVQSSSINKALKHWISIY